MIKIEKGIPMPTRLPGAKKYPWGEMDQGDSFYAPGKRHSDLAKGMKMATVCYGKTYRAFQDPNGVRIFCTGYAPSVRAAE